MNARRAWGLFAAAVWLFPGLWQLFFTLGAGLAEVPGFLVLDAAARVGETFTYVRQEAYDRAIMGVRDPIFPQTRVLLAGGDAAHFFHLAERYAPRHVYYLQDRAGDARRSAGEAAARVGYVILMSDTLTPEDFPGLHVFHRFNNRFMVLGRQAAPGYEPEP